MKVALLTDAPYCKDVRAQRTVDALIALGHEVFVLDQGFFTDESRAILPAGVHLASSPIPMGKLGNFWWHLKNNIAPRQALFEHNAWAYKVLLQIQPNIVHVVNPFLAKAGLNAHDKLGASLVYEAYEYWPEYLYDEEFGVRTPIRPQLAEDEQSILQVAQAFITVSAPILGYYERFGSLANGEVVLNINVKDAPTTADTIIAHEPLRLVFSGQFAADRNVDVLLKALSDVHKPLSATLLGRGPQLELYRALIEQLKLQNRVTIKASVPPSELISELQKYDIGVHLVSPATLQQNGAAPNKIFDYLRANLAIVSIDTEGVRSLGIDEALIFLPAVNPQEVAKALNALAQNPTEVARMKQASALAASRFTREGELEKIKALYRKLEAQQYE